jgi:hypothetical protein
MRDGLWSLGVRALLMVAAIVVVCAVWLVIALWLTKAKGLPAARWRLRRWLAEQCQGLSLWLGAQCSEQASCPWCPWTGRWRHGDDARQAAIVDLRLHESDCAENPVPALEAQLHEAREAVGRALAGVDAGVEEIKQLMAERDEARAESVALRTAIQEWNRCGCGMGCSRCARLLLEAFDKSSAGKVLLEELERLRGFKTYVHQRLDAAGVPVDPDSPHKAAGCRIGGRLDWVLDPIRIVAGKLKAQAGTIERAKEAATETIETEAAKKRVCQPCATHLGVYVRLAIEDLRPRPPTEKETRRAGGRAPAMTPDAPSPDVISTPLTFLRDASDYVAGRITPEEYCERREEAAEGTPCLSEPSEPSAPEPCSYDAGSSSSYDSGSSSCDSGSSCSGGD